MNCEIGERRISDSLDGKLSEEAARDLEVHLTGCPSCRAYRARLEIIQRAAASAPAPVPDGDWDGFSARVRARLESGVATRRRRFFPLRGWRWSWLAAPAAAGVLIFLLVFRPVPVSISDLLTYEERLEAVRQAVSGDEELAGGLDAVILGAIQEETGVLSPDELPAIADDPVFWDSLTEEEAALVEREIAGELKS